MIAREKENANDFGLPEIIKDKKEANKNTKPNEFIYPYYGSMIYWITKGYEHDAYFNYR